MKSFKESFLSGKSSFVLVSGVVLLHESGSPLDAISRYSAYFIIGIVAGILLLLVISNYLLRVKIRKLSYQIRELTIKQKAGTKELTAGSVTKENPVQGIVRSRLGEASLVHEKEIESLVKLASSLSHDLNNLVGSIMGYASLLKKKLQPETKEFHYADIIENSSKQITELVKRVLGFSQLDTKTVEVVNLSRFTEKIAEDFRSTHGDKFAVSVTAASQPAIVRISTSQLKQVLLAVLDNAADSMETGGIIECSIGFPENPGAPQNLTWKPMKCFIAIEDHGTGMAPEIKQRIFEPFFTTKQGKKYTGLNLSQVFNIVKQHNGSISVDSSPGVGTKVKIYLPLYSEENTPPADEMISQTLEMKGARVLVVDDEENVRQLGFDILTEHGFQVITANDGADALEKLKDKPDIRLVVLDMIMPVMTGKEACIEIKKMKNPPKVLICTGFSELSDLKTILGTYAEGLLQKPYSIAELLTAVKNILKNPSPNEE